MKKKFRITAGDDFRRVMAAGRIHAGRALVAFAVPSRPGAGRIGVTTSRRITGSVARNRARRRLREATRLRLLGGLEGGGTGIGYDVVLIARPDLLTMPFSAVEAEVDAVRRRLDRGRR